VEFEVEKDMLVLLVDHIDHFRPGMCEELFPNLKEADPVLENRDPALGFGEVFHIESKNDLVFWITKKGMVH
jgi:hypothetical protein